MRVMEIMSHQTGSYCYHQVAFECGVQISDCTANFSVDENLIDDQFSCVCGCKGNYPKILQTLSHVVERVEAMNSGTPSTSELQQLLSELCPMLDTAECMLNSPECEAANFTVSWAATSFQTLLSMKSQCTQLGESTDYAEAYVFPSPSSCPYISTQSGASGALGVQLSLLAVAWSLSILK